MAGSRILHYALIGSLLGLLPSLRWAGRYFQYISYDSSPGITAAQLAWVMLKRGFPEIVVSALIGAAVGILVSRRHRLKSLAGADGDGLSGTKEGWPTERQAILLLAGMSLTAVLMWYTPHLMLYPCLGVALAWVIARRAGATSAGGVLFLGGLLGNVVHFWSGKLFLVGFAGAYATNSAELGLVILVLFVTLQALGPTLLLMGLSSSPSSEPAAA